jgi:hypothetical protein
MPADELLAQPSDVLNAWPAFGALPAPEQTSLLNVASQRILDHCRQGFASTSVTDALNGNGLSRLWLSRKPVISIASVTMDGDLLDNTDGCAYSFTAKTGELRRGDGQRDLRFAYRFSHGRGNIIVVYWAGYASVPDPIVRATIWMVQWIYEQGKSSNVYSSERIGDYQYTLNVAGMSLGLPTQAASLCIGYVQDDGPF